MKQNSKKYKKATHRGFTLVEMIVALGVFTAVVLIAVSSLLNIAVVHQKTQSSRNVMDNLNLAVEDIARNMRVGIDYHCGNTGDLETPRDCAGGDTFIAFVSFRGVLTAYRLSAGGGGIERSTDCLSSDCSNWRAITAPEIDIEEFAIFVRGAPKGDGEQPRVLLIIRGTAGIKQKERVTFNVQTTVSQRIFDS